MKKHAVISDCGKFRYRLWRKWGEGSPLLFIMLNPSTADAEEDDATIRRCTRFAEAHSFGALEVVNLFAYRATDPKDLKRAGWPVGPDNDQAIREAVLDSASVCLAWGSHAAGLERPGIVLQQLRELGVSRRLFCLRITRGGYPQHPLMLPSHLRLMHFDEEAVRAARLRGTGREPPPAASRANWPFPTSAHVDGTGGNDGN